MLRNAKVGDWVFSLEEGWSRLTEDENDSVYCVDGRRHHQDKYPSAWPEGHPDIPHWAPDRPRVVVRKECKRWVNLYHNKGDCYYTSELSAKQCARHDAYAVAVPMTGTYEVEE